MSHFKKTALKASVIMLALWGGHNWINQTPERADNVASKAKYAAQVIEDKTEAAFDTTSKFVSTTVAIVSDMWDNIGLDKKVDDLQDRARPLRTSVITMARPVTQPAVKASLWVDNKMSLIGIVFILIAGSMVAVMSASMLDDKDYS